jgi:MFS family permease
MQAVAENWLVLSLTGSALFLGVNGFLQQVPVLLFTLFGGVLADRRDRRRTLIASQYVQMATAFALAVLTYTGQIRIWQILTLSFVSGCAQAFGSPAYLALTPSLVGPAEVTNALALNALQFNIARFIGPVLAGATLVALRERGASEPTALAVCFALNALSFIVVIAALASLRVERVAGTKSGTVADEVRSALAFVVVRPALIAVFAVSGMVALAAQPVIALLPLFADLAGNHVAAYSGLMACAGAGAVAGTLVAAWLGNVPNMTPITLSAAGALGVAMISFALSDERSLTYSLLFLVGAGLMLVSSMLTSLAQREVPDTIRGRVMGLYLVAARGSLPVGVLVCGYLASVTSVRQVVAVGGLLLFATGMSCLILGRADTTVAPEVAD